LQVNCCIRAARIKPLVKRSQEGGKFFKNKKNGDRPSTSRRADFLGIDYMDKITYQSLVEQTVQKLSQELLGYHQETISFQVSEMVYTVSTDHEGSLSTVSRYREGEAEPAIVLNCNDRHQFQGLLKTEELLSLYQYLRERDGLPPVELQVIPTSKVLTPDELIKRVWELSAELLAYRQRSSQPEPIYGLDFRVSATSYQIQLDADGQLRGLALRQEEDWRLILMAERVKGLPYLVAQTSPDTLLHVDLDLQRAVGRDLEEISLCSADSPFLLNSWARLSQYLQGNTVRGWVEEGSIPEVEIFGWVYRLHPAAPQSGFALEAVSQPGIKALYDPVTGAYEQLPESEHRVLWRGEENRIETSLLPEEYEAFWIEVEAGLGQELGTQVFYAQAIAPSPIFKAEADSDRVKTNFQPTQLHSTIAPLDNLLTSPREMSRVQGLERLFHYGNEGVRQVIFLLESDPAALVQKTAIQGLIEFNKFSGIYTSRDEQLELSRFNLQEQQLELLLKGETNISPADRYQQLRATLLERNPSLRNLGEDILLARIIQAALQKKGEVQVRRLLEIVKSALPESLCLSQAIAQAKAFSAQESRLSQSVRELTIALGEEVQPGFWKMTGEAYHLSVRLNAQSEFLQINSVTHETLFQSRDSVTQISSLSQEEQSRINEVAQNYRETLTDQEMYALG
jgi:hypothetical protein